MEFEELTDAQKEQFKNAESPEELMNLIAAEGIELTDEQLDVISGGNSWYAPFTK